jgi:hypothetical protein
MVYRELSVGKSVGQSESVTIMIKNNPSIKPLPMLADGSAAPPLPRGTPRESFA